MASTHASLDAASIERKARLARLKSLKRKQPDNDADTENPSEVLNESASKALSKTSPSVTTTYLSGRNYDSTTRGPKLGFEVAPTENQETLEDRAARIAEEAHEQAEQEEKEEKPIDLFKLQPKKPNWDLKRDVAIKMERLNTRTENAIARLVRERIEAAKRKEHGTEDDEAMGMKGEELVEGVHVREREEEEERREREREEIL